MRRLHVVDVILLGAFCTTASSCSDDADDSGGASRVMAVGGSSGLAGFTGTGYSAAGSASIGSGGGEGGSIEDAGLGNGGIANAGLGNGGIANAGQGNGGIANAGQGNGGIANAGQGSSDASAGCGAGGTLSGECGSGGSETCEMVLLSADAPEARALQESISRRITESPDCGSSSDLQCSVIPKSLDCGRPWCVSVGRRILHLDEFTYGHFEETHGRILAYLTRDSSGGYVEWRPTVTMQQGRFAIERDLGEIAFPLDWFKAMRTTFDQKYPYTPPSANSHGVGMLQRVHALVPRAQSLVAPLQTIVCDPERTRIELRLQIRTLTELVARYAVRYIVMSAGVTQRTFSDCPQNADQLLRLQLDEFYAPLAAIPGTILIQSAPNETETDRELLSNDPEFLIDCTPIPGRIRVSYAARSNRAVPPEGLPYGSIQGSLPTSVKNTVACVDLFVAVSDEFAEEIGTSQIPPWVVAMAIAAENALPGALDATGVERVERIRGDNAPRLYDPIANHQYEPF